jgi:hypothetical protein
MLPVNITTNQWKVFNRLFFLEHFIGLQRSEKYLGAKRKKLYNQIAHDLAVVERGGLVEIDTINCDNGNYTLPDVSALAVKPFLFKGVAKAWPCIHKWNAEFFRKQMGDYVLDFEYDLGFSDKDKVKHKTDLASLIEIMKQDKSTYLRFCRIVEQRPELKADLDTEFISHFKHSKSLEEYYLFMGEANSTTGLHSEITETLTVQIQGKKKWILFPPEERIFFNPLAKRYNHFLTHANPEEINDEKFPLLRYAKRYEVTLEPGDALWFPAFYWHFVRNVTSSIGLSYKHLDLNHAWSHSKILTTLFFLRTHPNVVNPFTIIKNRIKSYA